MRSPSTGESFNSPRPLDGFSPSGDKHQPLSLSFSLTDSGFSSALPCRMNKNRRSKRATVMGEKKKVGAYPRFQTDSTVVVLLRTKVTFTVG